MCFSTAPIRHECQTNSRGALLVRALSPSRPAPVGTRRTGRLHGAPRLLRRRVCSRSREVRDASVRRGTQRALDGVRRDLRRDPCLWHRSPRDAGRHSFEDRALPTGLSQAPPVLRRSGLHPAFPRPPPCVASAPVPSRNATCVASMFFRREAAFAWLAPNISTIFTKPRMAERHESCSQPGVIRKRSGEAVVTWTDAF
jgi:hypothetical protein